MATENIVIRVESRGFKTVQRDIRRVQKTAKSATSILQQMRNVLVVVAAVRVIRGITDLADGFVNLRNRLQATLGSFEAAVDAQKRIVEIARETRTSVDATGDAFARFALGTKGLGISSERLLGITKTLNQALILSGTTAQEARSGLIQLSQGIASNRLSGDELRSVLEQLPPVSIAIARELGIAVGQLRKFGEEGKITGEVVFAALEGIREETEENFQNAAVTIEQSLTKVGTEVRVFIDNVFNLTGASEGLAGAILSLATGIKFLGENIALVNGLLATLGTLLAIKAATLIFAGGMALVNAAVIATATSTGVLAIAVAGLQGVLIKLNLAFLTTPLGVFILGLSLAVGAIVAFSSATETSTDLLVTQSSVIADLNEKLVSGQIQSRKAANDNIFRAQTELALARSIAERVMQEQLAEDALGERSAAGGDATGAAELEQALANIKELTSLIQKLEAAGRDAEVANKKLVESLDFSGDQLETLEDLEFELSQFGRSSREAAIAAILFAEREDIATDKTGKFADELRRLGGAIFDAEEAVDRLKEAQKEADKASEKRIDLINRLKGSLETTAQVEIRVSEQLNEIRKALIQSSRDAAEVDALLAREKKKLVDAQREELFPELTDFLEDQKTLRERLNEVQTASVEIKRQAIQDNRSEAEAIALQNVFIEKQNKLLIENSEARQLADQFFTADKAARDFADAQAELNKNGKAANLTVAQQNELLRAQLRASAGASNATLEYAQAQQKLNFALKEGAVSAEEAIEITRRNRIELLESQRTAEAGAERSFLKFIEDATDAARQTEELMTGVFNNLEDALFDFVKTGKLSFDSLVQTIIDGLIRIAIQQAIGGAFGLASRGLAGSSGTAGGSAGGIGGFVASGLLGAHNGAQFTVGASSAAASLPGIDNRLIAFKARDGEDVTVTPRGEGAGGLGGSVTIVQNIQTKDADSFRRSESQIAARASATLSRARRRA